MFIFIFKLLLKELSLKLAIGFSTNELFMCDQKKKKTEEKTEGVHSSTKDKITNFSKIQLVVYYQCCVLIG